MFIWVERGNEKAANLMERAEERFLSAQTYMELLQDARDKKEYQQIREFLLAFDFAVLQLSENIGHRACVYVEEYSLSHGLRAGDAIVAATATENNLTLVTSHAKHFRPIRDLKLKVFKP